MRMSMSSKNAHLVEFIPKTQNCLYKIHKLVQN